MKSLHDQVVVALLDSKFTVKTMTRCFDVVARKDGGLMLIKVVEDANSLTGERIQEMKHIATALDASPLIICEKGSATLKDNVVYTRHGMYAFNLPTFLSHLNSKPLYVMSKKSGITTKISGDKLRELRQREGLSLGLLSKKIGVSKRMVVKYENEDAEISLQHAVKMHNTIGRHIFKKIEILSTTAATPAHPSSDIGAKYEDLGFIVRETRNVPFDVVAKRDHATILTKVGDTIPSDLGNISAFIGAHDLAIFRKKKPRNIPALTKEEFLKFDEADELIRFVQEF